MIRIFIDRPIAIDTSYYLMERQNDKINKLRTDITEYFAVQKISAPPLIVGMGHDF